MNLCRFREQNGARFLKARFYLGGAGRVGLVLDQFLFCEPFVCAPFRFSRAPLPVQMRDRSGGQFRIRTRKYLKATLDFVRLPQGFHRHLCLERRRHVRPLLVLNKYCDTNFHSQFFSPRTCYGRRNWKWTGTDWSIGPTHPCRRPTRVLRDRR